MHIGFFTRIFVILPLVSIVLDWYVFSGLKTLTKGFRRGWVVRWVYLAVSVTISVLLMLGADSFKTAKGLSPFHEWVFSLFLTFLVTKLLFSLVLLLGDAGQGVYTLVKPKRAGVRMPGRRRFISELATLAAAVPFTGFMYAIIKGKYDYRVHRTTLYYEELPAAFDGFTITQLSDIHSGSFDNTAAVQRGIDLAQAQRSDLFVFTGDLVNNAAWEIEPYIDRFKGLTAPHGQFSVLGNHDYGDYVLWDSKQAKAENLETLKRHHAALGYRLLMDQHVVLEKGGQQIALAGVQNWGRGFIQKGDLDKALSGIGDGVFTICLSHDPTHWEEQIRYHRQPVHLTLSGHTHGAQFGVETDKFRWSPVKYRYLDWAGLANEGNRYLYVNRGFGFLAFSGRLGIWPEITVITLKKGRADQSAGVS